MLVAQLCPTLRDLMDRNPPGSSVHGLSGKKTGVGPFPSPGDLPDPGIKPGLLHCRQILHHVSHVFKAKSYNCIYSHSA